MNEKLVLKFKVPKFIFKSLHYNINSPKNWYKWKYADRTEINIDENNEVYVKVYNYNMEKCTVLRGRRALGRLLYYKEKLRFLVKLV